MLARNNRNHGCDDECNHHKKCDPTVSREVINEHLAFCVVVCGDYEIDADDEVVRVVTNGNGTGDPVTVTLPCPDDVEHDCAHVTVVAQDTDVVVNGLSDANNPNRGARTPNGEFRVRAGSAVTFWHAAPLDDCACGFWIVECCESGPLG